MKTEEQRFLEKIDKTGPIMPHMTTACWLWTGAKNTEGYGAFCDESGKMVKAHRYSYEFFTGNIIEDGYLACHHCDNPPCINPEHVFPGTNTDNMADMYRKGRGRKATGKRLPKVQGPKDLHPLRGEKNPAAKITEPDVTVIRQIWNSTPKKWGLLTKLGKRYNVYYSTIRDIVTYQSWSHIN